MLLTITRAICRAPSACMLRWICHNHGPEEIIAASRRQRRARGIIASLACLSRTTTATKEKIATPKNATGSRSAASPRGLIPPTDDYLFSHHQIWLLESKDRRCTLPWGAGNPAQHHMAYGQHQETHSLAVHSSPPTRQKVLTTLSQIRDLADSGK